MRKYTIGSQLLNINIIKIRIVMKSSCDGRLNHLALSPLNNWHIGYVISFNWNIWSRQWRYKIRFGSIHVPAQNRLVQADLCILFEMALRLKKHSSWTFELNTSEPIWFATADDIKAFYASHIHIRVFTVSLYWARDRVSNYFWGT